MKLLYENEGITDALFRTFLVYVASSNRPPHELLRPNLKPLEDAFVQEFEGMTTQPVTLSELLETRARLIDDITARLDDTTRRFLLSLHDGAPEFDLIGLTDAANLPAVQWKLLNLRTLQEQNPVKHGEQREAIERL